MIDPDTTMQVDLDSLQDLAVNQKVNVRIKAVTVHPGEEIERKGSWRSLQKQECLVADDTGTGRTVLWQQDIGRLEGHSYTMRNVTVRTYDGVKYLSVSEVSTIEEIDDIGSVVEAESDEEQTCGGSLKVF